MPARARNIYVQIDIRAPLDRIWRLTQTPDLHQQWDLRFSEIRYLPRPDPTQPQRFLYSTRIGLLHIRGEGETVGEHDNASGQRTSALKFSSDDPKSLILHGSGYWKYIPCAADPPTVRFLTMYDYNVRFGLVGRFVDRLMFRPLIGWATAWSFDRLRLWAEKEIDPALSMRRSLIYLVARITLALVWLYQGLVPKLIIRHRDELQMLHNAGISSDAARRLLIAIGWGEIAMGAMLLFLWRTRWPLWLTFLLMPAAVIGVVLTTPDFVGAPFNPITLNLCVFALAAIALLGGRDLPSASRCLRAPDRKEP
ncbi:MAG: hypothetical protein JWN40_5645 [Phycisphaerales bacterium]|nr:hypothetical protein [Phycisphaerales bacterium]